MQFQRIEPPHEIKDVVECYWTATNTSSAVHQQKIIPDGFPELIFHFSKPYKINLSGDWETQADNLIAGQLTKFFFLENTGQSDILGIKLKPTAATALFHVDMSLLKNKVVTITSVKNAVLSSLKPMLEIEDRLTRIERLNSLFKSLLISTKFNQTIERAVSLIFSSHGMTSVTSICNACDVGERQLERLFKNYIGISPKLYARIIRFSYIFQVMQKEKINWTNVGLESGYYDQAHFIKNFKAFTGEDPTKYFFDKPSMANFFLKK